MRRPRELPPTLWRESDDEASPLFAEAPSKDGETGDPVLETTELQHRIREELFADANPGLAAFLRWARG